MHTRRLIAFLLGAWMGASVLFLTLLSHNVRSVGQAISAPPPGASKLIDVLGRERSRALLHYGAAEQNRAAFDGWELAQLVLAGTVFALLLFATSEGRHAVLLAAAMAVIVAVLHWVVGPDLVALGKQLDFVPAYEYPGVRHRFRLVHGFYYGAEMLKMLLGAVLLSLLLRRRSRGVRQQIHTVDHADHGHVDG